MSKLKIPDGKMYIIGRDNQGEFIECNWCGYKSHNVNDIKFKYCGACHRFLEPPPVHTAPVLT